MSKDPVCGMTVNEKTARWRSQYERATYAFCSPGCQQDFDRQPAKYAKAEPISPSPSAS